MKIELTSEAKTQLERHHRTERDGRVRDRIKAVLLKAEGWSLLQIAQALRIHEETVRTHLNEYQASQKLKPENGGSASALTAAQTQQLIEHLEVNMYSKVSEICAYVVETFGIQYSVPGMTDWLHRNNFSYKQPKGIPSKADPEKQAEFIKTYARLMNTTPDDEPILFGDGVHPTMATKLSHGWIRTGQDYPIKTVASRTRLNLFGAINLQTMMVTVNAYETIDSKAMEQYFKELRGQYPTAPNIHLILDNGPYNKSQETKESAKKHGIVLHFLPPYSPNLNPIERLWKVMNEKVRNNVAFKSAGEFKEAVMNFFSVTWKAIAQDMVSRINDNFQSFSPASSS
jgi:transposase